MVISRRVTARMRRLFVLASMVAALAGGCSQSQSPAPPPPPAAQQEESGTSAAPEATNAPDDGSVRYLALGDSVTQGVGARDEQTGSFPALLAEKWRGEGCEVELQNAGISGYTARQILDEQVPQIEEFKPTVITFQSGGNDLANGVSADDYRSDVQAVLDAATGSGARVIVLAQNEWFRAPGFEGYSTPEAREEFDSILIEEAQSKGAQFVDMRPIVQAAGRREPVGRGRYAPHTRGLRGLGDRARRPGARSLQVTLRAPFRRNA